MFTFKLTSDVKLKYYNVVLIRWRKKFVLSSETNFKCFESCNQITCQSEVKISNKSIIVTIYLWWRTFCSCCTKRIQGFMQICQHSDSCNNMHYVLYIGCNTNKVIVINNKYSCNTCMHSCWEVHQKSQKGSKDSCKYVCMHCCCKYTRSPNQVTKALCSQCTSCGSTKV